MSIELDNVASGYSTGVINSNFEKLEQYINDMLLNRDGLEEGQPNQMELDLDMNGNSILNANTDLTNSNSLITVGDADDRYVNVTGDNMTGPLDMRGNDISDVGTTRTKSLIVGGIPVKPPTDLEVPYVIYVDTISDLQALTTSELVDGQQVQVKEYHAGTGVGGGEFYWDAPRTGENDGGTVIDGWVRIVTKAYITPFDFGARSDADSSIELQNALSYCSEHNIPLDGQGQAFPISAIGGEVPASAGSFREDWGLYVHKGIYLRNIEINLGVVEQRLTTVLNLYTGPGYVARIENVKLTGSGQQLDAGVIGGGREDGGMHGIRCYGNDRGDGVYEFGALVINHVELDNFYSDGLGLREIPFERVDIDTLRVTFAGRNAVTCNSESFVRARNLHLSDSWRTAPRSGWHYEPNQASDAEGYWLQDVVAERCSTGIRTDSIGQMNIDLFRVDGFIGRENDFDFATVNRGSIYKNVIATGFDVDNISISTRESGGLFGSYGHIDIQAHAIRESFRVSAPDGPGGTIEKLSLDVDNFGPNTYQGFSLSESTKINFASVRIGKYICANSNPVLCIGGEDDTIKLSIEDFVFQDPNNRPTSSAFRLLGYGRCYIYNTSAVGFNTGLSKRVYLTDVQTIDRVSDGRAFSNSAEGARIVFAGFHIRNITPDGGAPSGAPIAIADSSLVLSSHCSRENADGTFKELDFSQEPV